MTTEHFTQALDGAAAAVREKPQSRVGDRRGTSDRQFQNPWVLIRRRTCSYPTLSRARAACLRSRPKILRMLRSDMAGEWSLG